jgi:hypothetical protein
MEEKSSRRNSRCKGSMFGMSWQVKGTNENQCEWSAERQEKE